MSVLDYGLGNLFSIKRGLEYVGACVEIISNPDEISSARRLVLPGVGAFGDGVRELRDRGLIEPIREFAELRRPLLGICLGMQLFFSESDEFGVHQGLNLIEGKVVRLRDSDPVGNRVKVPHIGWSELILSRSTMEWNSTVLEGLKEGDSMYFIHSYVPRPENDSVTIARIKYEGYSYCAVVEKGNVTGCQFHPEKSGEVGLRLLHNFVYKALTSFN